MAATEIEAPAMAAITSTMAPWWYLFSLPTLSAQGLLTTTTWP
jgi:hypothetical protein